MSGLDQELTGLTGNINFESSFFFL